jgi:hypothetical protein
LTSYGRGDDQYFRRVAVGLLATEIHCEGTVNPGWLHFHSECETVVVRCGGCGALHDVAQAIVDYIGLVFIRFSGDRPIEKAQFAHNLAGYAAVDIAVAIGEYFALRKELGLPPIGLE